MKNILVVMNLQNGLINTPEKTALSQKIIELTRKHVFDRVVWVKFVNRDDGVFPKSVAPNNPRPFGDYIDRSIYLYWPVAPTVHCTRPTCSPSPDRLY